MEEIKDVEKKEIYKPLFDEAVVAYMDAPIYGESLEGIKKVGEGKFTWDRNGAEFNITPETVSVSEDEFGPNEGWINFAKNAQAFSKSILELWENLPGAAQTKENLTALAVAKKLEEYRI
ncbi:MAG: hypothetical protein WC827_00320 [Candidatus Paceibacterota bacterium]|jgi:hypothetical protein